MNKRESNDAGGRKKFVFRKKKRMTPGAVCGRGGGNAGWRWGESKNAKKASLSTPLFPILLKNIYQLGVPRSQGE